jgi:hypothetical protein
MKNNQAVVTASPALTRSTTTNTETDKNAKGHDEAASASEETLSKTPRQKRTSLIQLAALSWCLFNLGWNDGTPGPLLPRMQAVYHASG